jgi:urease accessory protein
MVLTEIFDNVSNIADLSHYHVETAQVRSDDLAKKILRVTSDHGRNYDIRISDEAQLENGSAFEVGDHKLLVLSVIPDEVIVIAPNSIDQMGVIAHMLGNLHKPIEVKDGTITLLRDPVVEQTLAQQHVDFSIQKRTLDHAMRYAQLGGHVHEHDHHHGHAHGTNE